MENCISGRFYTFGSNLIPSSLFIFVKHLHLFILGKSRVETFLPAVLRTKSPVFVDNKGGEHCEVINNKTPQHRLS